MIIRQIRILRTNGKADGNGATWPSPGRGLGVGNKEADCQGRRYLRTEKAAMTCGFFCSEVPSRIELLYTVLQTVA